MRMGYWKYSFLSTFRDQVFEVYPPQHLLSANMNKFMSNLDVSIF
jgi:hypothetical protein